MFRLWTRFVLSGVIATLKVLGLVVVVIAERRNYADMVAQLDRNHEAALQARTLSTA